jgi:hypothetical protein
MLRMDKNGERMQVVYQLLNARFVSTWVKKDNVNFLRTFNGSQCGKGRRFDNFKAFGRQIIGCVRCTYGIVIE